MPLRKNDDKINEFGSNSSYDQSSLNDITNPIYQNDVVKMRESRECQVCSELSDENIQLEPCHHKPACKECSSKMKKCLQCGVVIQKRVTRYGEIISAKNDHVSAERMRYLEWKIAKIEKSQTCSLCTRTQRNVVFLCGHGACSECAYSLDRCHVCRETIKMKVAIYSGSD